MMTGTQIREIAEDRGKVAKRLRLEPFAPESEDDIEFVWNSRGFPNLGAYVPKGWTLGPDEDDFLLVDKTGLDDSGWALTQRQLRHFITTNLGQGWGYAVVEEGQFQVVVGVFKREV